MSSVHPYPEVSVAVAGPVRRHALASALVLAAASCAGGGDSAEPADGAGTPQPEMTDLDVQVAEPVEPPATRERDVETAPGAEVSVTGSGLDDTGTAGTDAVAAAPTAAPPSGPPSDERSLEHVTTIRGDISPKSVVSSHTGVFFAQNMMYRHTITVYDADHELVATIPDRVDLGEFDVEGHDAEVRGAPVEAAFSPDGRHAYVSNYRMYGPGFDRGGGDRCTPQDGHDDSFVYRVDVATLEIDQVIAVGSVPKYVAVTPDGRYVLVTNWCSYDLSVIDAQRGHEVERLDIGRYPRGIAVTADASTAYVALMGSTDIAVVDLDELGVELLRGVGSAPRHLVLDPDERYLYATLNGEGVVVRLDLGSGEAVRVETGEAPRSMDISTDGRALYVVNYHSDTVTKVRTSDMVVVQTLDVDPQPIGITYDRASAQVWVAHYSGSIQVFADR